METTDKRDNNRKKLQALLRELFQFDSADLDFGIYRIMNEKRAEVDRFIEQDLLDAVEKGLAQFRTAEREELEKQLAEKRAQLGEAAFDKRDEVREKFQELNIAREFMELRQQLDSLELTGETEARIFNDLYTFFSRYYDNGDFLTERRYSSKDVKFSVPYNGEEVLLHWANRDQYYIKTTERFADYRFSVGGYTVWFQLERAEVPQDNVKSDKRYFVLREGTPLEFDEESKTMTIFFEYRPITDEEEARLLSIYNARQPKNGRRKTVDRAVLCEALEIGILEGLEQADLKAHLAVVPEDGRYSTLGRHLNRYTARNTMDYFVHKDLGGFLRRELDSFLRSAVLKLDDVIADERGELRDHLLARARVVKQIAERVIALLAQIEDFQKRLFEKKKFVVQTDYCITLDRVPREFYAEILDNEEQLEEWRRLYNIDAWEDHLLWTGQFDAAFLQKHPYLMLNTAFFSDHFKLRLLEAFDDLDAVVDGVVLQSENYHALSLMALKYREQVSCVHIDPPYNTQTSRFLYKNVYQHSSWLAMMHDRISASMEMMSPDGAYLCHIDENEYERLHLLFQHNGFPNIDTIVWDKKNPMLGRKGVATQHEYVIWGTWADSPAYVRPTNIRKMLSKAESLIQQHGCVNDEVRREFAAWLESYEGLTGGERAYRHIDDEGRIFQSVAMGAPEPRLDPKFHIPLIHPATGKECPVPDNGWSRTPETLQDLMEKDEILFGADETVQPRRKVVLTYDSKRQLSSVIRDAMRGKTDVVNLGLEFPYCHPVSLYEELLGAAAPGRYDVVLDFFAGSGTTAHAVINLNREDHGRRKYILVEVDDCANTALMPRIQKVAFGRNWTNGVPQDDDGTTHMFKYHRLESYEDSLNNVRVSQPQENQRELLYEQTDDYMLSYMLGFETRDSRSLLTPEAFIKPFEYTLKIQQGHQSPHETVVDLVETFHYLIGMHVHRLEHHEQQNRRYVVSRGDVRTDRGIEKVVTIWRDTEGLDLEQEAAWANSQLLTEPVDRVYVNGPSFIDKAEPLEITFRELMEGGLGGA